MDSHHPSFIVDRLFVSFWTDSENIGGGCLTPPPHPLMCAPDSAFWNNRSVLVFGKCKCCSRQTKLVTLAEFCVKETSGNLLPSKPSSILNLSLFQNYSIFKCLLVLNFWHHGTAVMPKIMIISNCYFWHSGKLYKVPFERIIVKKRTTEGVVAQWCNHDFAARTVRRRAGLTNGGVGNLIW